MFAVAFFVYCSHEKIKLSLTQSECGINSGEKRSDFLLLITSRNKDFFMKEIAIGI